jgi:hypothetical protein
MLFIGELEWLVVGMISLCPGGPFGIGFALVFLALSN